MEALWASRDAGITELDAIATCAFPGDDVKNSALREYLRHNLRLELSEDYRKRLKLFYVRAYQLGLAPCTTPPQFYNRLVPV